MGKIFKCVSVAAGVCGGILAAAIIRDKYLAAVESGRFNCDTDNNDDADCVDEETISKVSEDIPVNRYKIHLPFASYMKESDKFITVSDMVNGIKSPDGVVNEDKRSRFVELMSIIASGDESSAFFNDMTKTYIAAVLDMTLALPEEDRDMKNFMHILELGALTISSEKDIVNELDKRCADGTYIYSENFRKLKDLAPNRTRFGIMASAYKNVSELIIVD